MRKMQTDNKKKKIHKTYLYLKKNVFFGVFFLIAIIGLILPLRPKTSEIEKRELTHFPKFTLASFLNGDYFSGISTWYADTFPFREALLAANSGLKNLYGLQNEQIVYNSNKVGDEIPEGGSMVVLETESTETNTPDTPAQTETSTLESNTEISKSESGALESTRTETDTAADETAGQTDESDGQAVESTAQSDRSPQPETYADGAIHNIPEASGDVYVSGDTAFGIYYFNLDGANAYIKMIDKAQKRLDGVANVYDILVPTSVGVCLDENAQKQINSSNQKDAIQYITSNINALNSKVTTVDIYDTLKNHNSEYIYFRTDHHWTARGAYYAYVEFCKARGLTPASLSDYETVEYPNFLGSFYASSNQAQSLKENPDTVIGYIPQSTNDMFYIDENQQTIRWRIVNDVSDYSAGSKYSAFSAADQMYAQIDNPQLSDGSSCVVIKESFGNAFIPFLVDHYAHIYIVDYRYFRNYAKYDNDIYKLITENNVSDVIFINNADAMTNPNQVALMSAMFD